MLHQGENFIGTLRFRAPHCSEMDLAEASLANLVPHMYTISIFDADVAPRRQASCFHRGRLSVTTLLPGSPFFYGTVYCVCVYCVV